MKLPNRLRRVFSELGRLQIPVYAGNAAFFLLLSAFPLAILLLALLPGLSVTRKDLLELAGPLVPETLLPLLSGWLDELQRGRSFALLSGSALLLLWSGSGGMLGVLCGLNAVSGAEARRGYLRRRAVCLLAALLALAAAVLAMLFRAFGPPGDFRLYSVLLLALFFTGLYRWLPDARQPLARVWPGALASAGGWIGFARLFSLYAGLFGRAPSLYGGLALLLFALLWLYGSVCIVFYGAFFNRALRGR